MEKRRGKSSDRISLKVAAAVCVVSFIAGVAYTKADRTAILLTSDAGPQTQASSADAHPQPIRQAQENAALEAATHRESKIEGRETKDEGRATSEWRTVRMRVTGYCPCSKCCGEFSDGVTANGHKIQPGDTFVAADKRYSFGTELSIPGYSNSQVVKVLDRGGAIRGDKLDAFFHTHQAALEWGVKYLDVQVKIN